MIPWPLAFCISLIERRLDPATFVRIHRSTIVNIAHVAELRARLHGEAMVVLASGRRALQPDVRGLSQAGARTRVTN